MKKYLDKKKEILLEMLQISYRNRGYGTPKTIRLIFSLRMMMITYRQQDRFRNITKKTNRNIVIF